MVKQVDREQAEILNDFIDALIMECKPTPPLQMNQEMSSMFETVRGIKRLRSDKEALYDEGEGLVYQPGKKETAGRSRSGQTSFLKPWMKWASAAAAIMLVAGAMTLQQLGQRTGDMAPMSMEMAEDKSGGFFAMADAYDRIDNYQGTLEVRYEFPDYGWTETVEITYEKPNRFYTVTRQENQAMFTRIYDGGDQLISFHGDGTQGVMVDYMGPELLDMYLSDYHMGSLLTEIQSAPEVKEIGTETVNGREALLFEYRYDPEAPYHRAWIDQNLQLPVKVEANFIDGGTVTREFTRLAIDVPIDSEYFAFDLSEVDEIYYASREAEDSTIGMAGRESMAAAEALPEEDEALPESAAPPRTADMPAAGEDRSFSLMDVDVHDGSAVFVRRIDSYYVQLRLIGGTGVFEEFKLSEELRRQWQGRTMEPGSLFSVIYETGSGEVPVVTLLEPIDQISVTAFYMGRADSNFGEFEINGQMIVIALSESVQSAVEKLDSDQKLRQGGIPVSVIIEASTFSTSGMITSLEPIRE